MLLILKQQWHQGKRGGSKTENDLSCTGKQAPYANYHEEINGDQGKKGKEVNAFIVHATDILEDKKDLGIETKFTLFCTAHNSSK